MFTSNDVVARSLKIAEFQSSNRDTLVSFWSGIAKPTRQQIVDAGNSYISSSAQPFKVKEALEALGGTEIHQTFIRQSVLESDGNSIEFKFPLSVSEDINLVEGTPLFAVIVECDSDSTDWYRYSSKSGIILIATVGEIGSGSDIEFKNNYLDSDSRVRLGSFTLTVE